jgi:hypothetical protein
MGVPRRRGFLLLLFLGLPSSAQGFDPRAVDIIHYRLGMTEGEVVAVLTRQGFYDSAVRRMGAPCAAAPAQCVTMIEARTRDGELTFAFSGNPGTVARITYAFDARKPGEPEAVEQAVVARYGPPTTSHPMTWCDRAQPYGACPAGAPRLVFEHGPGVVRILTLTLR